MKYLFKNTNKDWLICMSNGSGVTLKQPNTGMNNRPKKRGFWQQVYRQRQLVVITMPFLLLLFIFNYVPLWGWVMAFQNYRPHLGISGSQWVGLEQFKMLFAEANFYRALRNTLAISSLKLVTGFLSSITLAVLLNEVRQAFFKRTVQTISLNFNI